MSLLFELLPWILAGVFGIAAGGFAFLWVGQLDRERELKSEIGMLQYRLLAKKADSEWLDRYRRREGRR